VTGGNISSSNHVRHTGGGMMRLNPQYIREERQTGLKKYWRVRKK